MPARASSELKSSCPRACTGQSRAWKVSVLVPAGASLSWRAAVLAPAVASPELPHFAVLLEVVQSSKLSERGGTLRSLFLWVQSATWSGVLVIFSSY